MRQVIDASVVLAHLRGEPGGDIVVRDDGPFCLSSVNLAEIMTKVIDLNLSADDVTSVLKTLPIESFAYGTEDAVRTATLRTATRPLGLSLGDRACLALATRLAVPVLTADTAWAGLDLDIEVRLIR
ncbi:type II toxin-antitoxin system VapC family toxin [Sphingomonas aerolata]|jgi:ribonuclease VapC|uniref:type II toxin-antitoxin system VapC family toxin n=1 Tax=Sphingomonas aerolata TaxID=185951 RepID=UPI00141BD874|nr:type II toxin-antitoxin system VapC family toxin [Sphingomonas aerolata]NII57323.1 PIN domain nuclease of toxin-antitoxin system [Sphingomonas aerolata]